MSNAQKTLQSGGQIQQPTPTPTPAAPPALNINIPGLGGNQAPAGVSYTPGTGQYAQVGLLSSVFSFKPQSHVFRTCQALHCFYVGTHL